MQKEIKLSNGKVALVDSVDYEKVNSLSWLEKTGYAYSGKISMHGFILGKKKGFEIDHKNRNRLDNRRSNLRFCTRSQNVHNSPKKNCGVMLSKFKGVTYEPLSTPTKTGYRKRIAVWKARIGVNWKRISLGYFKTEEEAARAYDKSAKRLIGEFAKTNF